DLVAPLRVVPRPHTPLLGRHDVRRGAGLLERPLRLERLDLLDAFREQYRDLLALKFSRHLTALSSDVDQVPIGSIGQGACETKRPSRLASRLDAPPLRLVDSRTAAASMA